MLVLHANSITVRIRKVSDSDVLPILTLLMTMYLTVLLGKQEWNKKVTRFYLIAIIALIQTSVLLLAMFTMQAPKF